MAASSSWEFEALAQELIRGVAFSVPLGSGVQRAGRSDDMVRRPGPLRGDRLLTTAV